MTARHHVLGLERQVLVRRLLRSVPEFGRDGSAAVLALAAVVGAVLILAVAPRECASEELAGPPRPLSLTAAVTFEVAAPRLAWSIAPVALSLGADYGATEWCIRVGRCREGNPLPGMRSSAGRAVWAGATVGVVAIAHRRSPQAARKVAWAMAGVHVLAAAWNVHLSRAK